MPGRIAFCRLTSIYSLLFMSFLRCFSPFDGPWWQLVCVGHRIPRDLESSVSVPGKNHVCHFTVKTTLMPVGLFLMVLLYTLLSGIAIVENYRPILISPSPATTARPICGSTPPGFMVTQPTTVAWSSQCQPTLGCYPVIVTMSSHDSSHSFAL